MMAAVVPTIPYRFYNIQQEKCSFKLFLRVKKDCLETHHSLGIRAMYSLLTTLARGMAGTIVTRFEQLRLSLMSSVGRMDTETCMFSTKKGKESGY